MHNCYSCGAGGGIDGVSVRIDGISGPGGTKVEFGGTGGCLANGFGGLGAFCTPIFMGAMAVGMSTPPSA